MSKRSSVRIDDDLMSELKALAHRENVSLTRILNRVIRQGLTTARSKPKSSKRYKEVPVSMGKPRVEIDKALTLAAELEDEEIIRKLSLRK